MHQVAGYAVWIGNIRDAQDPRTLNTFGISAVVDLASNELPITVSRDMAYCRFPLSDCAENPEWLIRAALESVSLLIRSQIPTFVFCSAGMSRSPAVVAGAIELIASCGPAEALQTAIGENASDVSPGLWADVQRIIKLDHF